MDGEDKGAVSTDKLSILIDVIHVQQSFTWDCGLACAKMVVGTYSLDPDSVSKVCSKFDIRESVWTIDLAFILKEYGLKLAMFTVTLGVDQTYANESFYTSNFNSDEGRVTRLFSEAADKGVHVEKRSMSIDEIISHLMTSGLVIVLIDWTHLSCIKCKEKWGILSPLSVFTSCLKSSYQGHYITLCGCDQEEGIIYYRNPSYSNILCHCSYETLDKARQQYGTDEDIIFIHPPTSS
ncbi:protein GUCD1-like [Lineus longissimus]|uniref:protein GUCD1-like n=1 Tax=Lineus longissimus TaxID=88925 RepID=UPI002B4C89D3